MSQIKLWVMADYEEFQPETYRGMTLTTRDSNIPIARVKTDDPEADLRAIYTIAQRQITQAGDMIVPLSCVDHFFMDNRRAIEEKRPHWPCDQQKNEDAGTGRRFTGVGIQRLR